jgi:hypothetical protein
MKHTIAIRAGFIGRVNVAFKRETQERITIVPSRQEPEQRKYRYLKNYSGTQKPGQGGVSKPKPGNSPR